MVPRELPDIILMSLSTSKGDLLKYMFIYKYKNKKFSIAFWEWAMEELFN